MIARKILTMVATISLMVFGTALAPQSIGPLKLTGIVATADQNLVPLQERNAQCIEAWQQSVAFKQQLCREINVRWHSYWVSDMTLDANPGWLADGTRAHIAFSRCLVHVKCDFAAHHVGEAIYNHAIRYRDVAKIRRCKDDPKRLDTSCELLTQGDVLDIVAQSIENDVPAHYHEHEGQGMKPRF